MRIELKSQFYVDLWIANSQKWLNRSTPTYFINAYSMDLSFTSPQTAKILPQRTYWRKMAKPCPWKHAFSTEMGQLQDQNLGLFYYKW